MYSGSSHEMPDVVSRQEVPDKRVTAPPWPELIEVGGRSMVGLIVEAGGDVFGVSDFFKVIFIVFRVET